MLIFRCRAFALTVAQGEVCAVIYSDDAAFSRARQNVTVQTEGDSRICTHGKVCGEVAVQIIFAARERAAVCRQRRPARIVACMVAFVCICCFYICLQTEQPHAKHSANNKTNTASAACLIDLVIVPPRFGCKRGFSLISSMRKGMPFAKKCIYACIQYTIVFSA